FDYHTSLLLKAVAGGAPNACFVLSRLQSGIHTHAGVEPVGLTLLQPRGADSLQVVLFQSPDAGYYAVLRASPGELHGRGASWGVADAAVSVPDDSVYARRIGPPQRSRCIDAANAAAARLDSLRHPATR